MKSNFNELRKEIVAKLATVKVSNVGLALHYRYFPKPAGYPYAVYDLQEMGETEGKNNMTLEIDICTKDVKTLQDYSDLVQDMFDHSETNTAKLFFHSYRVRRYSVVEEDKTIYRNHISIELYYYSKEN